MASSMYWLAHTSPHAKSHIGSASNERMLSPSFPKRKDFGNGRIDRPTSMHAEGNIQRETKSKVTACVDRNVPTGASMTFNFQHRGCYHPYRRYATREFAEPRRLRCSTLQDLSNIVPLISPTFLSKTEIWLSHGFHTLQWTVS
jgi:hypothetical protein